jgi:hypothetical protein
VISMTYIHRYDPGNPAVSILQERVCLASRSTFQSLFLIKR